MRGRAIVRGNVAGRIGGTQAFLTALGSIPIKDPLVDFSVVGDFYARVSVFISAGPYVSSGVQLGFPLAIKLPRQPTFFLATSNNGAILYQSPLDVANTTPSTFYVRTRVGVTDFVSTVATILVA